MIFLIDMLKIFEVIWLFFLFQNDQHDQREVIHIPVQVTEKNKLSVQFSLPLKHNF